MFFALALLLAQNFVEVRPSPQQSAWQELEIGVLVHFGLNTFTDKEWGDGTVAPGRFNPSALDAGQWVTAAQSAGARYLILVAKHHDGFCLWPSAHTRYSVASSPWRGGHGDLVREVSEACRKHGLRFGIYLSPWDRHEPSYHDNAAYDRYYAAQLSELATRYGDLTEWWLDGAGSEGHVYDFERYGKVLRTYQPNVLVFADTGFLAWGDIRWVGNEDGVAPLENWNVIDRLGYLRWRPAECDTPLRERHWFWHPDDEKSLKPVSRLLEIYHRSVGRGAQLVLGLAPDNRGLLPDSDVVRLTEFGAAVRRLYGKNVAEGALCQPDCGSAVDGDPDTAWAATPASHRAELTLTFPHPVSFDRVVLMEMLADGQRIQKYDLQVLEGGRFQTVIAGTTIGHKKIDIFPRTTTSQVRLRILAAAGAPQVREIQLY